MKELLRANARFIREAMRLAEIATKHSVLWVLDPPAVGQERRREAREQAVELQVAGETLFKEIVATYPNQVGYSGVNDVWPQALERMKSPDHQSAFELQSLVGNVQNFLAECAAREAAPA